MATHGRFAQRACLFLLLSASVGVASVLGPSRGGAAEPAPANPPDPEQIRRPDQGDRILSSANRAAASEDYSRADGLYRRAWKLEDTQSAAARALRDLHRTPGFSVPVDEPGVRRTLSRLGTGFIRYDTRYFVILSNCSVTWTRQRATLFERTRDQFFRAADQLGVSIVPPQEKLVAILFADHDDYAEFAFEQDGLRTDWIAGYYSTKTNRVVLYDDSTSPAYTSAFDTLETYERRVADAKARANEARRTNRDDLAERLLASAGELDEQIRSERARLTREASDSSQAKTIHEAVHLLSFSTGLQDPHRDYPFWFSEGLAVCFETSNPNARFGPAQAHRPRAERARELRRDERTMPTAEFVSLGEVPDDDGDAAEVMYHQAYELVTYLHRHQRQALAAYIEHVRSSGSARENPERRRQDFERFFGSPSVIDARLEAEAR